jgi:hypothetical protein
LFNSDRSSVIAQKSVGWAKRHMIGVIEDADFYQFKINDHEAIFNPAYAFAAGISLNFADFSQHV